MSQTPPTSPLRADGDWYLNLLLRVRAGVRVADLRPFGDYVAEAIETELRSEGLPADAFSQPDRNDVRVAKTASRRTLGFMKEMAFELEWHIAHDGGRVSEPYGLTVISRLGNMNTILPPSPDGPSAQVVSTKAGELH